MPRCLDANHLPPQLIAADAGRAPLRGLSCPSGRQGARRDERPPLHRSLRSFGQRSRGAERPRHAMAADTWRWGDVLITDFASPPTGTRRRMRQWTLVAIAAFMLAAVLAQVGW
jgi:hypothetical protein